MLNKESKIRVLENFYALDYIFFGKPLKKYDTCCPLLKEEYLSVKGALMSVCIEMLQLINHQPKEIQNKIQTEGLMVNAKKSAKIARENAKLIVSGFKAKKTIKKELHEALQENKNIDVSTFVSEKIREKAFSLAVDNILIARPIAESTNYKNLNEYTGKIIEDSYKVLRDSLVETAKQMIHGADDVNYQPVSESFNFTLDEQGEALVGNLEKYLSNKK